MQRSDRLRVSPEQVLVKFKQNGSFDSLRNSLLASFQDSEAASKFSSMVNSALQSLAVELPRHVPDRAAAFEKRLAENLTRQGRLDQLERAARNHLMSQHTHKDLLDGIRSAVDGAVGVEGNGELSRRLEVDGLRGMSTNGRIAGHSFYKHGDEVAAFVPTTDPLCTVPKYACIQAVVVSCDAPKNMYTIRDKNALPHTQSMWAVYWEQMLMIKKAMEQNYRIGDQVYALYRDDLRTDTAVSTEFFPGRIAQVGELSLAVEFYDRSIGHVYYDELFAAGR
ncbi:hypothetical protein FBU59_006995, partial [Linderina macrospora]